MGRAKNFTLTDDGGAVFRFSEQAPTLIAGLYGGKPYWVSTKGVWFRVRYNNGVEQTCRGGGSATVRAPAGTGQLFTIDGDPITINSNLTPLKLDMTAQQTAKVQAAWNTGKKISVSAKFQARCQDGKLLQKTLTFQR